MRKIKIFITIAVITFVSVSIFYANPSQAQTSNISFPHQENVSAEFDISDSAYFDPNDIEGMMDWMFKETMANRFVVMINDEESKMYLGVSFYKESIENADSNNVCNTFKTKVYKEIETWSLKEMDLGKHVAMRYLEELKMYIAVSFYKEDENRCCKLLNEENFR